MNHTQVIIIGGGPAGSACAWTLSQHNIDFLLLDRAEFPRFKPCAGWVTPQIWRDLQVDPQDYPHGLTHFTRFQVAVNNFHFTLRTNQYAIRRVEFDDWLLRRVLTNFVRHNVRNIDSINGEFVIDGEYAAPFLIGAGGTHCPVRQLLVTHEDKPGSLIVAMEEEFNYPYSDERCHLWFFQNGLPGYAWYVPKANGVLNVGIGGSESGLKAKHDSLKRHWNMLIEKLDFMKLVTGHDFKPAGHSYYLRGASQILRKGNAFLVGDALGLATIDMGEGIDPAIQSGIRAAQSIIADKPYSIRDIHRYSLPSLLGIRK